MAVAGRRRDRRPHTTTSMPVARRFIGHPAVRGKTRQRGKRHRSLFPSAKTPRKKTPGVVFRLAGDTDCRSPVAFTTGCRRRVRLDRRSHRGQPRVEVAIIGRPVHPPGVVGRASDGRKGVCTWRSAKSRSPRRNNSAASAIEADCVSGLSASAASYACFASSVRFNRSSAWPRNRCPRYCTFRIVGRAHSIERLPAR